MLVAHNYDSITAFERSVARKGEVTTPLRRDRLIPYLRFAEIDPAEVFFTNALMGCKPGSAVGPMPRVPGYEDECGRFLREQIAIVRPRALIALGGDAFKCLRRVAPQATGVMHPGAREFSRLSTRDERLREQATSLRKALGLRTPHDSA